MECRAETLDDKATAALVRETFSWKKTKKVPLKGRSVGRLTQFSELLYEWTVEGDGTFGYCFCCCNSVVTVGYHYYYRVIFFVSIILLLLQ